MRAKLYLIPTPTRGRLAILPRPRGGDWLADEVAAWRRAGVDVVVSMLTPDEVADLELTAEADESRVQAIEFLSLPIPDRGVPAPKVAADLIARLTSLVADGKTVAVHCRQGIGRSAVIAAGVLITLGADAEAAIRAVADARGCPVPETAEQRRWIIDFAASLVQAAR
jgi:protein-tyrosine phosphatase